MSEPFEDITLDEAIQIAKDMIEAHTRMVEDKFVIPNVKLTSNRKRTALKMLLEAMGLEVLDGGTPSSLPR